ncbi:elongation factor G [Halosquirtibacter xylanolyticus]|uniref:elongation factor G n=1 Tax=Halosquirtibacter xylanolyticus TaxID=3374599 RepID=UPI00374863B4|nr:elongation factor G [Prolixibacteraceae bacterium]
MKTYKTCDIRNLTIIGGSGSGKTTLCESMLFEGGVIGRRGSVAQENTVSDHTTVEHEYRNSVFSSVLYTEYNDRKLNIIDTPGMDDFVGNVIPALRVAATGIMVINATEGIEVGTEIATRQAKNFETPLIFTVNQLDRADIQWDTLISELNNGYQNHIALIQYPVETGENFHQVIDVLKMKMYQWGPEGGSPEILDIPDSELEKANELHNELVEKAAENDEKLMELFFDKGTLTEEEMREGIKKGMLARELYPLFCICAEKDMGVRRLMEFICNVAPAPNELKPKETVDGQQVFVDEKDKTSLFFFKTSVEPHVGEINYFKVNSGILKEGDELLNTTTDNKEKLSQLFVSAGKNRVRVNELHAGDIGATVKLKETKTDHTLCDKTENYKFRNLRFPKPRYTTAIKAVNESDDEKVAEILHKLSQEDPTWKMEYAKELKQLLVHGQGEYHINTLKWYFDHIYKVDIQLERPRISYRETITKPALANFRHKKQSGGSGQFGEVHLMIEPYIEGKEPRKSIKIGDKEIKLSLRHVEEHPLKWGGKLIYCNCIVGGVIDARFQPAILKGIMEKMEEGPLTGSYARDIIVYVYDGKMHPVDSNEISFKIAGRTAFSQAFKEADPKILEPIYKMQVFVPSDKMGDVMSDLQGRRAMILGMESSGNYEVINVQIPLKETYKYSTALSSLTNGRAMFKMEFDKYEKMQSEVQKKVLEEHEEVELV